MAEKHLFTFLLSLAISAVTHHFVIRISHRRGIFMDDSESELPQKLHDNPTPRIGGIGIFLSSLLILSDKDLGIACLAASVPAFLSGIFEDLRGDISPKIRLSIMLISGLLSVFLCKAVVTNYEFFTTPYFVGAIITVVAIIGLVNGANMLDGFNGLLSIVSLIIFGAMACVSYQVGDDSLFHICIVLCAALVGFIIFNYPKGAIFMGDGGAYFLGFSMAIVGILLSKRHPEVSPMFVLTSISYVVMEVIFSFVRKGLILKTNPLMPDRLHFHHLVSESTLKGSNNKTVLAIIPVVLALNTFAILFKSSALILTIGVLVFIGVYVLVYQQMTKSIQQQ
jgi:UDP-GlcNAc:undecaprenyl-phosphate/decaprenyl-phosphate GlcNAc-1-phosphate transferase